uniref:Helicase ATP-binding domain-containing protein n=1 Tax=Oryza rufipogon TaxID=4529 RepID=A0A0E0PCR6_ORYRU
MRRGYEEIDDDEWSNHSFKPSRVLKRPSRGAQPDSQPPPPIDSFRYNPRPSSSSAAAAATATVVLSDDDDDFELGEEERLRRAGKSTRVLNRPQRQHSPPGRALPPRESFRYNPKPAKAAAAVSVSDDDDDGFDLEDDDFDIPSSRTSRPRRTAGRRLATAVADLSEEDDDLELADDDFDHPDPRPTRPRRATARRFVIKDDDDSDGDVGASEVDGVEAEEDDGVNWSELENEDDEDGDYGETKVEVEEGDVVGKALRKCARISADLRQELYGSSTRNCESYAEIDDSSVRIVTQDDVDTACTSEESEFEPILKPYQLVGVNFLLLLHRKNIGGAILADEMGLGKTVQAVTYLTLLRHLYNDPGPHLIVCPASVLENWERELKKWCPSFSIIMFHGAGRTAYSKELSSLGKAGYPPPFNVLLVCYSLFERRSAQQKDDRKALKRWRWSCVLMDEAHVLKDKGSFRWRNLMAVAQHARQRLMLTGTPLQNDLHELWSLLEFMMPDIFATGDIDLKKLLNAEDHELISRIKSILGPFILRRLKSDVMQQLVPKIQHVNFVTMDSEQFQAYNYAIDEYRGACQARSAKSTSNFSNNVVGLIPKRQISNYFMQFRKIANHPLLIRRIYSDKDVDRIAKLLYPKGAFGFECSLERATQELRKYNDFAIHQLLVSYGDSGTKGALTDEHVLGSAKCQALAELLPSLANDGHRVLIFSQWTTMLDILEWTLEVIGVTYRRLDGGWIGKLKIAAIALDNRNLSLSIDCEHITIFISTWLVTKGSVDENIYEIARRKLVLDAAILQSGAELEDSTDVPEKTMGEILASLLLLLDDTLVTCEVLIGFPSKARWNIPIVMLEDFAHDQQNLIACLEDRFV